MGDNDAVIATNMVYNNDVQFRFRNWNWISRVFRDSGIGTEEKSLTINIAMMWIQG